MIKANNIRNKREFKLYLTEQKTNNDEREEYEKQKHANEILKHQGKFINKKE